MLSYNGRPLDITAPFETKDFTIAAGGLMLLTREERRALGIVETDAPVRPDDRFFDVVENGDGTFSATPKATERLKAEMITRANEGAATRLASTDWQVIRKIETEKEIDPLVLAYRAAIREAVHVFTEAVAIAEFDDLMKLTVAWPEALK